jgi:glycosyltransferase involved in cell wall biosynthesis
VKLVYVTSRYPFGPGEAFLITEIASHLAAGSSVTVFPAVPTGGLRHLDRPETAARVVAPPWPVAAAATARGIVAERELRRRAVAILRRPQPRPIRTKNALALARVGALAGVLHAVEPDHVHAHWGSTSATLAMAAAEAVEVPWSVTLHRWDIYENNLLAEKIRSAAFTRVISERAARDLRRLVPSADPYVLHMGVDVARGERVRHSPTGCRFVCVASLVPVKNHAGLLRSFARAVEGADATLDLVGEGPLEPELRSLAQSLGLDGRVAFRGFVAHDDLLVRLRSGEWDVVVLASTAGETEHEGIPVSLMEAMAAGLPAVATDSGGTSELVVESAGLLVPAGDDDALAAALRRIAAEPALREALAAGAVAQVRAAFDAKRVGEELRALMRAHGR